MSGLELSKVARIREGLAGSSAVWWDAWHRMKTLGLSIGLAVVLSAALVESADAYELDSSLPTTSELPAPGTQRRARVAGGVDEFFAVWEDTRHGVSEIYGTRIDAVTGLPRDIGGIVIATSPARAPRVTFDGKQYLVAWSTGAKVRMARFDPSAPATSAVGKTTELLFKPGQQEPAGPNETATVVGLAASGNHFTVGVVTNDTGDMMVLPAKLYVAGVDPKSMAYIDGAQLDFVREGLNEGFKFLNPNERDRCGCGESFRV